MDKKHLLTEYIESSRDILDLDLDLQSDFEELGVLLEKRQEVLREISKEDMGNPDLKELAEEIMQLDVEIHEKISAEKDNLAERLEEIKFLKTEEGKKRSALKTYTKRETGENSVFFDQKK